jgi:hypothetical protein
MKHIEFSLKNVKITGPYYSCIHCPDIMYNYTHLCKRVRSTLLCFAVTTYFHKELILFDKSAETRIFFMNIALYPWNE